MSNYWDSDIAELLHDLVEAREGTEDERKAIDGIIERVATDHACEAVLHHGSRNPDSPNFGPDEACDNIAQPGEEFCAQHLGQ